MGFNKDTNEYEGLIYCFTNKLNGKKYIGQTQQSLKQRISNHLSKSSKRFYFQSALEKYGIDNFIIEVLDNISCKNKQELKLQLNEREKFYIAKHNTTNRNYGYNLTKGGECASIKFGIPVYQFDLHTGELINSYETMTSAALAMVGSENYNNILICARHETKQAYGFMWEFEPICNRVYTQEKIIRLDERVKVKQYTHYGELVKVWDCIQEASELICVDASSITDCCRGNISTCAGYVWRYENDNFNKYPISFRGKIIANYDDDFNLISIFQNAPAAAKYYSVTDSCIKGGLRNPNRKAHGYYWRYYEGDYDLKQLIVNL